MTKRIITAAITGAIHTPSMSPYLPITPDQIIDDSISAFEAGASVAHIHVRDPATGKPSTDLNLLGKIIEGINSRSDLVICITTAGGFGMTPEQRVSPVEKFAPELASLNAGSLNFALFPAVNKFEFKHEWETQYLKMTEDFIFPNTFKTLSMFNSTFKKKGTKPEFEIYDAGMISNLAFLINSGQIVTPVYLQFVLGIMGGMPANINNLNYLYNSAKEQIKKFEWSVCAAGKHQFNMCTASLIMGGHVRVGLEDNLYLAKGVLAKSSGEQVQKIVRIAKELGIEHATPEEARKILNLKSRR